MMDRFQCIESLYNRFSFDVSRVLRKLWLELKILLFFSDSPGYPLPPGMDPSFLFRSPLLSDVENNNLMAAAMADKARTMQMFMMAGGRPPGPPQGPPFGMFPGAAISAAAAAAASAQQPGMPPGMPGGPPPTTSPGSLPLPGMQSPPTTSAVGMPQLYTLNSTRENPALLSLPPGLLSQWQMAAAAGLQNHFAVAAAAQQAAAAAGIPPLTAPGTPPISTSPPARPKAIFPPLNSSPRYSPYPLLPKKGSMSPPSLSSPTAAPASASPVPSPRSNNSSSPRAMSPQ
jgi:hypothetical protein